MRALLIVSLIVLTVGHSNGQRTDTLRNVNHHYYLADIKLRTVGQWILADSIAPSDNHITFLCMDSITAKSKGTRDYFFPIFRKIVDKADGALAEVVGSYALGYAKKYPKELADRYKCCSTSKQCCDELKRFSSYAGGETMMRGDNKKEYDDLLNQMNTNFKGWRSNQILKTFIDNVDNVRRTWDD